MKIKESIKEYHAKSCLSKTKLWRILEKNPQWFKYCEEHQEADDNSPSLIFGAALHKAVLEYESFFDEYCVAPMIDRRTKAGKEAWQEFLSCAGGRIAIDNSDWAVIQEMRQAISENKYAAYLCSDCTADLFFYSLGKTLEALNCDPVDTEQNEEDRKERMKNAEIPL